jgi:BTB/POZ domain
LVESLITTNKHLILLKISKITETEENDSEPHSTSEVEADLKAMFENEALSDFQIEANDGVMLQCHKVILAARSKVFFAMLMQDMSEASTGLVKIKDFDSKIMKEVLRFIYCNEINDLSENAWELIYAAEKYDLKGLKKMCFKSIIETLTYENVLKALLVAHQIEDSESLYVECLKMIIR